MTWLGEAEGAPISLLRKWPHKSDRETHLWMLVKVLLLITSKVSEAEGGGWEMESSRSGSRCQLPQPQRQGPPCGLKQPQLPAAPSKPHVLWVHLDRALPICSPLLVTWKPPLSFPVSRRCLSHLARSCPSQYHCPRQLAPPLP